MSAYEPPIPFGRLQEMIAAIESGGALTTELRADMIRALDCLFITFLIEEQQSTPGRRRSQTQMDALNVHVLLTEYEAPSIKAAACAVMPNGDAKAVERLTRMYRKMKSGRGFGELMWTNPEYMQKIAARLKTGNK